MSVRKKNVGVRLTLFRECETCGQQIITTADSPFMRQIPKDGKRQVTVYYCSQTCKQASYKHLFDGRAEERRKEKEAKRDDAARKRKYRAEHREEYNRKARERYWKDPEQYRENCRFYRRKMKALSRANPESQCGSD